MVQLNLLHQGEIKPSASVVAQMKMLYDAEIEYTDGFVGEVVASLRNLGLLDKALIVLTSDHGEEFYDHGALGHGSTLYDEVLRVPLIISGVGVDPAQKIDLPVSTLDIMPTILDLIGNETVRGLSGVSLASHLSQTHDRRRARPERLTPARVLYAETSSKNQLTAVRSGPHKAIYNHTEGTIELYDIHQDPGEHDDIAARNPEIVRRFDALLRAYAGKKVGRPGSEMEVDSELRRNLEALGYAERK